MCEKELRVRGSGVMAESMVEYYRRKLKETGDDNYKELLAAAERKG